MIAIIFANGILDQSPALEILLAQADLLIAADGGANHCEKLGIIPDILIGDLDSIDAVVLATYSNNQIEIHRHPTKKDATDLELAIDLAIDRGARTIWLTGALGGRWDMSLANILLAAADKYKESEIFLLDQDCSMQILHQGNEYRINGTPTQRVSFLPLKGDAHGVTLKGFEYPLSKHTIRFGSSLAVSNVLANSLATVQFTEGLLLCILFRE